MIGERSQSAEVEIKQGKGSERTAKEKEIKVQSSRRGEIEATQRSRAAGGLGALQSRKRESDQAEQAKRRKGRKENSKAKSKGGKRTTASQPSTNERSRGKQRAKRVGAGGVSKEKP